MNDPKEMTVVHLQGTSEGRLRNGKGKHASKIAANCSSILRASSAAFDPLPDFLQI
jgi:hypothetical protein